MAAPMSTMRPLGCWNSVRRGLKGHELGRRLLYTIYSPPKDKLPFPKDLPQQFMRQIPNIHRPDRVVGRKIKVPPPPPSKCKTTKDPVAAFTADQLAIYDPTGERKAMFDKRNPHCVRVGDVLRVTFKSGDPFAGVCLNIRSRGLDTSFLLRNKLTRIGCEMWIKVFSPLVQAVEIVQRTEKRKRRARLTYMRKPKHDMGSVEGIVRQYMRNRSQQQGTSV
ncbi:mitochondrial ribosomal protein [Histoplasma capsulatum H143]|uniref:Mitochondrial ribosomal protein n=2 Tax=Ajellomyces capsulatus TaxID=5037 RepID=C6HEI0_AJECH|nr:mitochondrial ribosomal protein [Histoplasma capsulatum H143]